MSNPSAAQEKGATGGLVEIGQGARSPTSTAAHDLAKREAGVLAHEQAVLDREEGATLREEGATLREDAASLREEGASRREEGASRREDGAEHREKAAGLRERALRTQKRAAGGKTALGTRAEALLREANEQLVVAAVHAQTMVEAAEQTAAQMAFLAEHDILTGLPNRALLADRLERSIALAQRHGNKVALMYVDLDRFKHINDSLGHAVGDELLKSVAKRLQGCVRLSDTVSRQGGDEFMVLLTEIEEATDAALLAEKLIESMVQPHLIDEHQLHVTLSIGISIYPDGGTDAEAMVRNADIAMYRAKKLGRNGFKVFTPGMRVVAVTRQSVEQALHQALEQREFVLHFQPKVNLGTGAIAGAEALLRWQRSRSKLVRPEHFVRIAEDTGLILPIGKWVLREACRQTQAWRESGLDPGRISINVSAVELRGKDYLVSVQNILEDTALDPHSLVFELTESGLMQDSEQTTATLQGLKALGAQIAIDDFGTGYSNLSYLGNFPFDELKIDGSFVQAIDGNAGEAIVRAVIAMGTNLKRRVVAEGIETRSQLAYLRDLHCEEGQGYFLGRPMVAEKFAARLAADRGRIPRSTRRLGG